MKIALYPYKVGSATAKKLAETMGIRRVKHVGSKWSPAKGVTINWGASHLPQVLDRDILNWPWAVKAAVHKQETYAKLIEKNIPVPRELSWEEAVKYNKDGKTIYMRSTLAGYGGFGITVWPKDSEIPKLDTYHYFLRFVATHEYRIHVIGGRVVKVAQKKKRKGVDGNRFIRNHDNGYVMAFHDIEWPEEADEVGMNAVNALGLHFGAVDLGYNDEKGEFCVFEVNSAPGLCGDTYNVYAGGLRQLAEEIYG